MKVKFFNIIKYFKYFAACNCFQHSNQCVYDQEVDEKRLSIDIHGNYEGGGVCKNCQHNTDGINCHKCKPKFYRPYGKKLNDTDACQPCKCDVFYSTGNCDEGKSSTPNYSFPKFAPSISDLKVPTCRFAKIFELFVVATYEQIIEIFEKLNISKVTRSWTLVMVLFFSVSDPLSEKLTLYLQSELI